MTTAPVQLPQHRADWLERPQVWGAITIAVMWIAVLFVGVFGPDIVGQDGTRVPSVIVVAPFACIATVGVARRAFSPTGL